MFLASHFSDEIQLGGLTALLLLAGGVAIAGLALWRFRRPVLRWALVVLSVLPFGLGVHQVREVSTAQHNHLCHAHNSDGCSGGGYTHDEDGHSHERGGWAAAKGR